MKTLVLTAIVKSREIKASSDSTLRKKLEGVSGVTKVLNEVDKGQDLVEVFGSFNPSAVYQILTSSGYSIPDSAVSYLEVSS